jgi:NADH dehydrogenase FAD-containing subunit
MHENRSCQTRAQSVQIAASYDSTGRELTPAQGLVYDTLVVAVGSQTNDFGTLGAKAHTTKPESPRAPFVFTEQGSLLSLAEYSAVVSLMGSLIMDSFSRLMGSWPKSWTGHCTSSTSWNWATSAKNSIDHAFRND